MKLPIILNRREGIAFIGGFMGSDANIVIDNAQTKAFIGTCTASLRDANFEKLKTLLDQICSEVGSRFTLYGSNGKLRKAVIIDAIANSTCIACVAKKLSNNATSQRIDAVYRECHKLAVSILVEELCYVLSNWGYRVSFSTEANTEYGKVDVLIKLTNYRVSLQYGIKEVKVEVKTGLSLSLSQLLRYILDYTDRAVVLWRIRSRQVLVFEGSELKPLLTQFMKMIISRGKRLLESPEVPCEHITQLGNWSPTQQELQETLLDFVKAVTETLPSVIKAVAEELDINSEVKQS